MSDNQPEVISLARRLADRLEAAAIEYAIGGALALGQWSVPRGTKDVDLTLFIEEAAWSEALQLFVAEGAQIDERETLAELDRRGACRVRGLSFPVDIFVPSIAFYESVAKRVVVRPLMGRPARFLSAEDLAVFKLLFFRPKDLADVHTMLAVRRGKIDRDYIRDWLVEMVGESDDRVIRWDAFSSEIPDA